jgi:hypothetical protein
VLTLTLSPLVLLAFVVVTIMSLASGARESLPALFLVLGIVVADVATRDHRAGTRAIIFAAPRLRENLVWWKLLSTCAIALLFCSVPILLNLGAEGLHLPALLLGIFLVAAAATALGVITGNAKTFLVCFLTFWYVVVNERGNAPLTDFAGFYVAPTATTLWLYGSLSIAAVAAAHLCHRWRIA